MHPRTMLRGCLAAIAVLVVLAAVLAMLGCYHLPPTLLPACGQEFQFETLCHVPEEDFRSQVEWKAANVCPNGRELARECGIWSEIECYIPRGVQDGRDVYYRRVICTRGRWPGSCRVCK